MNKLANFGVYISQHINKFVFPARHHFRDKAMFEGE